MITILFYNFCSLEGILDIDAGDGGGLGGALGPQNLQNDQKTYFVRKLLTLLGLEIQKMSKNVENYL